MPPPKARSDNGAARARAPHDVVVELVRRPRNQESRAAAGTMVLDGDGNRWNAHVDPASGNTYYVNERTGVSSWTLPKKGTTKASNGASPLKIALGVVIIAVLACFLPADSALRGAVPFSFPALSRGRVRSDDDAWRHSSPRRSLAALRSLRLVDVVAALPGSLAVSFCSLLVLAPPWGAPPPRRLGVARSRGTLCVARGPHRTPSTPTRATAGAPSAERLLEAVSTRHLPDAATAAGGSASKTKLAGAAVVGLVCFPRPLFQSS